MDETKPSKSARKREYLARQKLGEELIPLQEPDLMTVGLVVERLVAVLVATRLSTRGAVGRQKRYGG